MMKRVNLVTVILVAIAVASFLAKVKGHDFGFSSGG